MSTNEHELRYQALKGQTDLKFQAMLEKLEASLEKQDARNEASEARNEASEARRDAADARRDAADARFQQEMQAAYDRVDTTLKLLAQDIQWLKLILGVVIFPIMFAILAFLLTRGT